MLSKILILEQKFTSRYVAPLGHIRLAISQQVLAVALYCCLQKIVKIERMLTLINLYIAHTFHVIWLLYEVEK